MGVRVPAEAVIAIVDTTLRFGKDSAADPVGG